MTDRGLMQEALSVLEKSLGHTWGAQKKINEIKNKLRERLAQPEPEPVAMVDANDYGYWADILPDRNVKVGQLLYIAPPRKEWVGLTLEEVNQCYEETVDEFQFAQIIEAKLKDKNT